MAPEYRLAGLVVKFRSHSGSRWHSAFVQSAAGRRQIQIHQYNKGILCWVRVWPGKYALAYLHWGRVPDGLYIWHIGRWHRTVPNPGDSHVLQLADQDLSGMHSSPLYRYGKK